MPFDIQVAEVLEGFGLLLSGLGVAVLVEHAWYAAPWLFGVGAACFAGAWITVRRRRRSRSPDGAVLRAK